MVFQDQTKSSNLRTRSDMEKSLNSIELNIVQKMKLRLLGAVYVFDHKEDGWLSKIPFYAFRCKDHGIQLGYPIGHSKILICPECVRK